jgi:hypothetical protein
MFKLRFVFLVLLIPLAGALGLLAGTSLVHASVMAPYEAMTSTTATAIAGTLQRFASETVDAAARAASEKDVHTALTTKKLTPEVEAKLLAPAGVFGAPSFALLVNTEGAIVASAGGDAKMPSPFPGFPVVAEALTGVARDGVWMSDGKPVHVVGAAIYDGAAPAGAVVLGWPYSPALLDTFGRGGPPVYLVGAAGAGLAPTAGTADLADVARREPFGAATMTGPFPVLLPDTARYLTSAVPLYAGDDKKESFALASVIDRDAAFGAIASLQLGILGLTFLLGALVLAVVMITLRAVNRPLALIEDHLAQVQQGVNVGILPEAGLGPFLRLGKQINMILSSMPSARPGATGGMGFGAPSFDAGLGSFPSSPPSNLPDSLSDIPSAKPTPSTPPTSTPALSSPPTSNPLSAPPTSTPPPTMSQPPAAAQNVAAPPSSGLTGLFDDGPDPLSQFRVAPKPAEPPPPPPLAPSFDDEAPSHAMQPEATVMFQVPESLLAASAVDNKKAPAAKPAPTAAPAKSVDDNRTVVAQVPQELLAQVAPKNDVDAADEAHYKEVYEKFVQTRIECGEDTSDLSYERFVAKLLKNRQQIVEKHKARSVRFQVYVKDGKAALRALPVRE